MSIPWVLFKRVIRDIREDKIAFEGPTSFEPNKDQQPIKVFRLLSMNIWGMPIAPDYDERMKAVEKMIDESDVDLILLQEAWFWQEREIFRRAGKKKGLVFSLYFVHGIGVPIWPKQGGSGMLVLSRYPIVDTIFHKFQANGKSYRFDHMDAHAGKGCGLLRIAVPGLCQPIDVFATHMISYYNPHGRATFEDDPYVAHRVVQSFEVAKFIQAAHRGPLVILAGDFNAPAGNICVEMPQAMMGLKDAFFELHPDEDGFTTGTVDNIYSRDSYEPSKIDHVLYRSFPQTSDGGDSVREWVAKRAGLVERFLMDDTGKYIMRRVDGEMMRIPISDHHGITAEFHLTERRSESDSASQQQEQQQQRVRQDDVGDNGEKDDDEVEEESEQQNTNSSKKKKKKKKKRSKPGTLSNGGQLDGNGHSARAQERIRKRDQEPPCIGPGSRVDELLCTAEDIVEQGMKEAHKRLLGHLLRFAVSLLFLLFLWWYLLFTEREEAKLLDSNEPFIDFKGVPETVSYLSSVFAGISLSRIIYATFAYAISHTWIPKVMLFLGLPYATVEFILGVFETPNEFRVIKQFLLEIRVEKVKHLYLGQHWPLATPSALTLTPSELLAAAAQAPALYVGARKE